MTSKQRLLFWLGWIISGCLLTITFWKLDWQALVLAFQKVHWFFPFLMVGIYLASFILRAWRWQFLLPQPILYTDSLAAVVLGYAANNVLPGRLGEIVRSVAIGQRYTLSKSLVLATVLVERIFDGLLLTGFLYIGSMGEALPQWATMTGWLGLGIFGGAFLFITFLAIIKPEKRLHSQPHRWLKIISKFSEGLSVVWRSPLVPLVVLALSAGVWLCEAGVFYVANQAFQFYLPFSAILFVLALVNLGILVPSSPGYLGAFQYFGALALSAWQVDGSSALAFMILIHACQYIPITLLGMGVLPYFGFESLKQLGRSSQG